MTLEDFFTLTEMKDGLTALSRVKELVTLMQKEKDCVLKNVCDATRQWSTVARTIAATENKDCLDLFIQLDGLWFIDRWLKDAQKFSNDTSESFVEESITLLLRALEKLHIDNEKSVSSGICMTVKNLLGHNSSRVQDSARALFDSWKQERDGDASPQDVEKVGAFRDNGINVSGNLAGESGHPECSSQDISLTRGSGSEERVEPARDEMMQSMSSDDLQSEMAADVPKCVSSSFMLKHVNESPSIKEDPPISCSEGATLIETCSSTVRKQGTVEAKSDVPELEYSDDVKMIQKIRSSENLGVMEISVEHMALSSSADAAMEPDLQNNKDAKDAVPCPKVSAFGDVRTVMSEGKSGRDDCGSPDHCRSTLVFSATDQVSGCNTNVLPDFSGSEHKLGTSENPDTSFSRMEGVGADDEVEEHSSDEGEDDLEKDVIDRRADVELDYGIVDPLEVARQVAIEVEREVVDCGEPSCSSSDEKISGGGTRQPDSPDSTSGKQSQPIEGLPKHAPTGPNSSAKSLSTREEPLINRGNLGAETEGCIQDMDSSLAAEAAQGPEKGPCDFDLNQEVCFDDMDRSVNPISPPISVVSASRAAVADGLPFVPLQFEGALGWKGSAATSAFRPASPRRITEGDKTLSVVGDQNNSKQRLDCLDIDLNVAEGGDDKIVDLLARKQLPILSSFPPGESSVELSPRKSERLNLDLNRVSDDGDAPSDWKMEGRLFQHRNGHHSPSPSSSSSSMQPSLRNIDLNDHPSFFNDSLAHPYFGKSSQNLNTSGGLKSDDSIISIMGTRVEVNRKDFVPQTLPLPNGRILEPPMDVNLVRTGGALGVGSALPFAHSPVYGYNGLTPGPTVPFSSAMFGSGPGGPIPYMVDSRGAPVIPQILGSASALPPAFPQSPFIMSMTGAPSGSNGAGPSRHNFDLNSGLMIEGGSRDTGGLRQLFNPGQGRSLDEHLTANAQPSSSSGIGVKRKEPESVWEPYTSNYKHHPPPWK